MAVKEPKELVKNFVPGALVPKKLPPSAFRQINRQLTQWFFLICRIGVFLWQCIRPLRKQKIPYLLHRFPFRENIQA